MRIHSTALWLPKDGNTLQEYEDAVFPNDAAVDKEASEFKCAVADGATETSFAALWAQLLVRGYADNFDIKDLRSKWNEQVHGKSLPWYAEQKASSGAFAALVGLTIAENNKWKAEAIGDSCLMQVRDGKILFSFPMLFATDFNNSPFLLSTVMTDTTGSAGLPENKTGDWRPGDQFWLMSDAIAHWTLKRNEDEDDAVQFIEEIKDGESFASFTQKWRQSLDKDGRPLMRNDDVTLLRVRVE
jgi:hypothetical protein